MPPSDNMDQADPEDPDPSDQDAEDDDATPTIECCNCGKEIYESAEFCHHCGKYLSQEDSPSHHPLWYKLGVILCLAILLLTVAGYLLKLLVG